jgi:hypothetical protein
MVALPVGPNPLHTALVRRANASIVVMNASSTRGPTRRRTSRTSVRSSRKLSRRGGIRRGATMIAVRSS